MSAVYVARNFENDVEALADADKISVWLAVLELYLGMDTRVRRVDGRVYDIVVSSKVTIRLDKLGPSVWQLCGLLKGGGSAVISTGAELTLVSSPWIKAKLGELDYAHVCIDSDHERFVAMKAGGPVSLIGGPGTGKTVIALNRASRLLTDFYKETSDRVLLTSYSNTLVHDLKIKMFMMLDERDFKRLDVRTIDSLAKEACSKLGYRIDYQDDSDLVRECLQKAYKKVDLFLFGGPTDDYVIKSFQEHVLDYDLTTEEQYRTFLESYKDGDKQKVFRRQLWPLYEVMLYYMEAAKRSYHVVLRSHAFKVAMKNLSFLPKYRSVVVDEAQDLGAPELKLLAALTGNTPDSPQENSIFFVGDGFQRLYGRPAVLGECGFQARGGRIRHLIRKNYRTTTEIREFAERMIRQVKARNLDGEAQSVTDTESVGHGPAPEVEFFADYRAMNEAISHRIRAWRDEDGTGLNTPENYAVLIRNNGVGGANRQMFLLGQAKGLSDSGLSAEPVDWDKQPQDAAAVKVMSMHRSKGLEFEGVVVVLDRWPHEVTHTEDYTRMELDAMRDSEMCLLFTAMMRARTHLFVTGTDMLAQKKFNAIRS